jgi:hypothetical protein
MCIIKDAFIGEKNFDVIKNAQYNNKNLESYLKILQISTNFCHIQTNKVPDLSVSSNRHSDMQWTHTH